MLTRWLAPSLPDANRAITLSTKSGAIQASLSDASLLTQANAFDLIKIRMIASIVISRSARIASTYVAPWG